MILLRDVRSDYNSIISLLEHKLAKAKYDSQKHQPLLQDLKKLKVGMECNPLLNKESAQLRLLGLLNQGQDFSEVSTSRFMPKIGVSDLQRQFYQLKRDVEKFRDFSHKETAPSPEETSLTPRKKGA
jgi:hypothetical protein